MADTHGNLLYDDERPFPTMVDPHLSLFDRSAAVLAGVLFHIYLIEYTVITRILPRRDVELFSRQIVSTVWIKITNADICSQPGALGRSYGL